MKRRIVLSHAPRGVLAVVCAAGAATGLFAALAPSEPEATSITLRTLRVAGFEGEQGNGPSSQPDMSPTGRAVAYVSEASNLVANDKNGLQDVFLLDVLTLETRLISRTPGGEQANAISSDPAMSGASQRVAFVSAADNLVPHDTNGVADVFLADRNGVIKRISVASGGAQANGPSTQPDITADGRYVVFTSEATNLIDVDLNGAPDVFVHDVQSGATERVSVTSAGGEGAGPSSAPSISTDGRFVSFDSRAANLVEDDENGLGDVFLRDRTRSTTELISVSSSERQQNAAVVAPFAQVSSVSGDGKLVTFESDADNLVDRDRNQDTDVFLRDRAKGRTERVSVGNTLEEGDNDSFAPAITPNGRYVIFQSFAENLADGDAPREDLFVRDLSLGATTVVSVAANGTQRGPETVPQLLQQGGITADGKLAVFTSTASNLAVGDTNKTADVFVRLMSPPFAEITRAPRWLNGKLTGRARADDPRAGRAICQLDGRKPRQCPGSLARFELPPGLSGRRHKIKIWAYGPGMVFDSAPAEATFRGDSGKPSGKIKAPRPGRRPVRSFRYIRGTARDTRSGVARVSVAIVAARPGRNCRAYDGKRFVLGCKKPKYFVARGKRSWSLRLKQRPHGNVIIAVVIVDHAGNFRTVSRLLRVR